MYPTSANDVLPVVFDGGKRTVFCFTSDGEDTWVPSSVVALNNVSNLITVMLTPSGLPTDAK